MNLSEVAEEIAAKLGTIDGLNAFSYPPGSVVPPAAVVLNPMPGEIQFDQTYRRGLDRMTLHLIVVVGRSDERSGEKAIRAYLDGSGPKSVKAVLEAGAYASCDEVTVTVGGVDEVSYAGVSYLGAMFDIDVVGTGA